MKVHVSTFLNASPTTVWSTVKRKELLHYVIAPMGKFSAPRWDNPRRLDLRNGV